MNIAITNNPMVRDKLTGHKVEFHDTGCLGIFKAVRDKIHLGHGLLTHPLSGNLKPGETPYKTVMVTGEKQELSVNSLLLIEESIRICAKQDAGVAKREWSEKLLAEFQLIDYTIVSNG